MRFILDENLSPAIAPLLAAAGHVCCHVRDVGLADVDDTEIMERAVDEQAIVISQDSDFTNLIAWSQATRPSLVLLRSVNAVTAADIAALILANLPQIEDALEAGAVVSLFPDRVRVRILPIY